VQQEVSFQPPTSKLPYEKPLVIDLGTIADLTQALVGAPTDSQITGFLGATSQG
jgi:hypothetical protein